MTKIYYIIASYYQISKDKLILQNTNVKSYKFKRFKV